MEATPPALEARSLNHWATKEVWRFVLSLNIFCLLNINIHILLCIHYEVVKGTMWALESSSWYDLPKGLCEEWSCCLPGPSAVCFLDKTPTVLIRAHSFWFELINPALAQEVQSPPPSDPNEAFSPDPLSLPAPCLGHPMRPSSRLNWNFLQDLWLVTGFLSGAVIKNLPANAGDTRYTGSVPASGWSPGVGNGHPLQYSCLENSMEWGAWWAAVHGVAKSGGHKQSEVTEHISIPIPLRYFTKPKLTILHPGLYLTNADLTKPQQGLTKL